jgi:hypothetical protein
MKKRSSQSYAWDTFGGESRQWRRMEAKIHFKIMLVLCHFERESATIRWHSAGRFGSNDL